MPQARLGNEHPLHPRIAYATAAPGAVAALRQVEVYLDTAGLEPGLMELVKVRASQINGCAYCLDMHTKDARARGEREDRLYALNAWRETPFFTDRERAALAWTEAVTLIAQDHVSDALFDHVHGHFSEAELVNLTLCIAQINAWNRLAVSFRAVPGAYLSHAMPEAT